MLMYSPLSAYFDDVIPQQPALCNDGKQRKPALGDFTSPMRSGIECLKRNCKNSHQQPLPGSLGKTGRAKAGVNIPLSQW
jgi:hypothetical protein